MNAPFPHQAAHERVRSMLAASVAEQQRGREPEPSFTVDRRAQVITWDKNGLRIVYPEQIRVLADIFAENGWRRHFNALLDAELALSDPPEAA